MKKLVFNNMQDLKKMVDFFETHSVEYSWHAMNQRYEIHLGYTSPDHVKLLIREYGMAVPFKWGDYYW